MDKREFLHARAQLNKTQKQLAELLGTSLKAVHSYEQGWRNIPPAVERQLLFLLSRKREGQKRQKACWEIKKCPSSQKKQCPAWEFQVGTLCWFINGTICEGTAQKNWAEKIAICRSCEVFISTFDMEDWKKNMLSPMTQEAMYEAQWGRPFRHSLCGCQIRRVSSWIPLRILNEDLELRVSQRTAELEAANKELKEFAYIVSHDLKAPLWGISRLAQWLQEDYAGVLGEQGQEQLDLLVGRVKRMDNLIDGILRYSRAAHEREESIDLNTLVSQVVETLAPPAHIAIRLEDELPVIHGDPIRLTQVFQNLLNNAVKFMENPDGKITVGCVDAGEMWTFRVEDNGPGIEPRHHERIFQIFQSGTPRDERENTGIGLTVVKKIVELHGGRTWVESAPGHGSRFYFTWPKRPEDQDWCAITPDTRANTIGILAELCDILAVFTHPYPSQEG